MEETQCFILQAATFAYNPKNENPGAFSFCHEGSEVFGCQRKWLSHVFLDIWSPDSRIRRQSKRKTAIWGTSVLDLLENVTTAAEYVVNFRNKGGAIGTTKPKTRHTYALSTVTVYRK